MPDYNFLPLLLPLFIVLATFDHCEGQACNKVAPTLLNPTKYNCLNGKSFCYPNVLSYTEFNRTDAPIQRKPSRRFSIIPAYLPLKSVEAWCAAGKPEAAGHFKKEFLGGPSAYLDDHLPMFVNLVGELWDQDPGCRKSLQNVSTVASTASNFVGTNASTLSKSVGTKSTNATSPTMKSTSKSTTKSTSKTTAKTTNNTTEKATSKTTTKSKDHCVVFWKYVKAAKFWDGYFYRYQVNGQVKGRWVHEWNYAVRVGFLEKPVEKEGSHQFKRLQAALVREQAKPLSGKPILEAEFIMQKLEKSSARDLNSAVDFDYLEIPVDEHEKKAAELMVKVRVHDCDGALFVGAAQKMDVMKKKPRPWKDWSKDLVFLNYCCYEEESIFNNTYKTEEIKRNQYWPEHLDAIIKEVKFGYVLPDKPPLEREQQLAAKYKYGLSLAKRLRFRNKDRVATNSLLPFTDGWFIAPPKLGVELPQEHKINIKFLYDGMHLEDEVLIQILQWTIRCDCSEAPDGMDGLMTKLKFFVPRIYAAVLVSKDNRSRKPNTFDIISGVKVDERKMIYKDYTRDYVLYDENEWKRV